MKLRNVVIEMGPWSVDFEDIFVGLVGKEQHHFIFFYHRRPVYFDKKKKAR